MFEDCLVGAAHEGVEVELIDATETASEIRVRSGTMSDGYLPEADERKLGNGGFCSGDAGATRFRAKDRGQSFRRNNVAGKKVNPAEVEAHLLRFKGVRQAVVFGRPTGAGLRNEEVTACVLGSPEVTETISYDFVALR